MVSSLSVLRESPVNRHRDPGAGSRSHSGLIISAVTGAEGRLVVSCIAFPSSLPAFHEFQDAQRWGSPENGVAHLPRKGEARCGPSVPCPLETTLTDIALIVVGAFASIPGFTGTTVTVLENRALEPVAPLPRRSGFRKTKIEIISAGSPTSSACRNGGRRIQTIGDVGRGLGTLW